MTIITTLCEKISWTLTCLTWKSLFVLSLQKKFLFDHWNAVERLLHVISIFGHVATSNSKMRFLHCRSFERYLCWLWPNQDKGFIKASEHRSVENALANRIWQLDFIAISYFSSDNRASETPSSIYDVIHPCIMVNTYNFYKLKHQAIFVAIYKS